MLGNNCSGKHTGMLLFARQLGADLDGYLEPDHPVQVANRRVMERFFGLELPTSRRAVDGCGVPTYHVPIESVATGFAALGADRAPAVERLHRALDAFPRATSGEGRLPWRFHPFLAPAFRSKEGAEGAIAVWGERGALVVKSQDGDLRGYRWALPELLAALGWLDADTVARWRDEDPPRVKNVAGRVVGRVEIVGCDLPDASANAR